ncbi:MAG: hypothetical protein RMK29_03235 [Myxococcales bacterium]|nr:hypothetical protein [Myxococcales bacterium]
MALRRHATVCILLLALGSCGAAGPDGGNPDPTPPPGSKKDGMTFYRDVLPILQRSCWGCHAAGGIAPFALTTYEEVRALHQPVANAVAARRMPPWMPREQGCEPLSGARRLSQDEIDTITSWSLDGAPAGDPADAPPPPMEAPALPWVDATLDAGVDYTPDVRRPDDYHCLVVDPRLQRDEELIGYGIIPGVRRQVHHVLVFAADRAAAQAVDASEPGPGWTCFSGTRVQGERLVAGWVPGMSSVRYPDGTGVLIAAGDVLILQIHYNHTGRPVPDRTAIQLQLARQRVPRRAYISHLSEPTFLIPPGAQGHSTSQTLTLPVPLRVYGVAPHMHTLGRRIQVSAGSRCLVDIPQWNFHWQQFYFFAAGGLLLERGTVVKMTCTWDNPGTQAVRWGEGTADEMCLSYFYVTAP